MTRLDENRAKSQLAAKAGTHVSSVSNLAIWGNHSSTQYPDFYNAKIDGKPATEAIKDEPWLKETFIPIVQQRGAAIIKARGASSAASAANAAIDTVWSLVHPTPASSLPMVGMQGKHVYIYMGGMFAVLKVRENLTSYADPGWYENPPGTLASLASNDELRRDSGQIP